MKKKTNSFEVAKILNTFGYKGELKVRSLSDFDRLKPNSIFYTYLDNEKITLEISKIRKANDFYIVLFSSVNDINDAKKLKGLFLYTDKKPDLKENEYHYQDLVGLKVFLEDETIIGEVVDIIFNSSQEILKIKTADKSVLVPFVEEFVKEVTDKIVITPIEGLL